MERWGSGETESKERCGCMRLLVYKKVDLGGFSPISSITSFFFLFVVFFVILYLCGDIGWEPAWNCCGLAAASLLVATEVPLRIAPCTTTLPRWTLIQKVNVSSDPIRGDKQGVRNGL